MKCGPFLRSVLGCLLGFQSGSSSGLSLASSSQSETGDVSYNEIRSLLMEDRAPVGSYRSIRGCFTYSNSNTVVKHVILDDRKEFVFWTDLVTGQCRVFENARFMITKGTISIVAGHEVADPKLN